VKSLVGMTEVLGAERDSYEMTILQNVRPEREFHSAFCGVAAVCSHVITCFWLYVLKRFTIRTMDKF